MQHIASEPATETEQTFGKLSISTVIITIVKLLEEERSRQVFHRNGKFRCFRGEPSYDRRYAIEKLELTGMEALFCGDQDEEASEDNAVEGEEVSEEYSSEEDDANVG